MQTPHRFFNSQPREIRSFECSDFSLKCIALCFILFGMGVASAPGIQHVLVETLSPLSAIEYVSVSTAPSLLGGLLLISVLFSPARYCIGNALRLRSMRTVATWVVVGVGFHVILNNLDIWPFSWRYSGNDAVDYVTKLSTPSNRAAVVVWCATLTIVVPLVEEIFCRLGLLGWLRQRGASPHAACLVSSLGFSLLHILPLTSAQSSLVASRGIPSFAFGYVLSLVTIRYEGWLWPALVLHASRNVLEVASLLILARSS